MLAVKRRSIGPDMAVLSLAGRLTLGHDCRQLEGWLNDLLQEGRLRVIFDLSDLSYIDSAGVGTVVTCFHRLKKRGGALRVARATGAVKAILQMTNLHQVVQFFPTVEAASTPDATLLELLP